MSLSQDLESLRTEQAAKMPPFVLSLFNQLIQSLRENGVEDRALKAGQPIPFFSLPNAVGKKVTSTELLLHGPLVVCFYRGAWCPYCNLELRSLQESLPDIQAIGANLVAISPMTPDNSLTFADKLGLKFDVLSDVGLKVASEFGLTYTLPLEIKSFFQKSGLDLTHYNGDGSWRLPIPATYVTDHDGIVTSRVNADWRERLDPLEIISSLQKIA